jgi:hypothetical protein
MLAFVLRRAFQAVLVMVVAACPMNFANCTMKG